MYYLWTNVYSFFITLRVFIIHNVPIHTVIDNNFPLLNVADAINLSLVNKYVFSTTIIPDIH